MGRRFVPGGALRPKNCPRKVPVASSMIVTPDGHPVTLDGAASYVKFIPLVTSPLNESLLTSPFLESTRQLLNKYFLESGSGKDPFTGTRSNRIHGITLLGSYFFMLLLKMLI